MEERDPQLKDKIARQLVQQFSARALLQPQQNSDEVLSIKVMRTRLLIFADTSKRSPVQTGCIWAM